MSADRIIATTITLAVAIMFLILGLVLRKGKGAGLIAGYNTSSPEEKRSARRCGRP